MSTGNLRELFAQEITKFQKRMNPVILIFVHRQADPDALCAAAGTVDVLLDMCPEHAIQPIIVVPQSVSSLGQTVSSQLNIKYVTEADGTLIHNADLLIIVDTGNPHLLEPYSDQVKESLGRKVLIDHHSGSEQLSSWEWVDASLLSSDATSTCEIIALGLKGSNISRVTAQTLLTGLMFDSQHLGIATRQTLEAALVLVAAGAEIEIARRMLRSKLDRSEVLARVKSAQRLQFIEVGRFVFVRSEVSSFQASVARMLLEVGGDVGIAYGKSNDEVRVSVRSTQSFYKETGVNLSTVVKTVCADLGMIGGGHPTASSISGKGSPVQIANRLLAEISASLPKT